MSKELNPSNQTKPSKNQPKARRKRTPSPSYSSQEKAQAVLAVWTEKANAAQVSREMGVNWITFNHWQRRALEGMLQALESRVNLAGGQALSPRLQLLLAKQRSASGISRLSQRLESLQNAKAEAKSAKA